MTHSTPHPKLSALYEKLLGTAGEPSSWQSAAAVLRHSGVSCNGTFWRALVNAWLCKEIFEQRSPLKTPEEVLECMDDEASILQREMPEQFRKSVRSTVPRHS